MILKIGSIGQEVVALQIKLGVASDGIFGPKTKAAVVAFQNAHNLYPDGIVGPLTLASLNAISTSPSLSEIHGIDIYHGDVIRDWSKLVPNGWLFASIKATQGLTYKDSMYETHSRNARSYGVIPGAYHFMSSQNGKHQAEFFVDMVSAHGGFQSNDLMPMLDWEYADGNPIPGDDDIAKEFLEEVKRLTGRTCIIYMNAFVSDFYNNPGWLLNYPLWLAAYNNHPRVPRPWVNYTIWQYSGSSPVPGIGNCDVDLFNGTLNDLKKLIEKSKLT